MTDKEILPSTNLEGEDKEDKDDGIKIFDNSVIKPSSIEATNTLNTLQDLCLFYKIGNIC